MTPAQQLRKDIEGCELPHPMFVEHRATLKHRIDDALDGFAPKVVRVPGPSGVGKSSVIASLVREYPETRIDGLRHVPVLVVEIRPSTTAKQLPKSVLLALGIKVTGKLTADAMLDLMFAQLRLCRTRVIIFDEASHLVDEGARVPPRAASDWLKCLTDTLSVTLILFGIPLLERLFTANEQLRRRSSPARYFLPYDASDAQEMAAYVSCVTNYARLFSAACFPIDVPPRVLVQQTYLLTGGMIGVLADFMRELARLMGNDAPRAITYADCQLVLKEVPHSGSPHILAFQDSGADEAGASPVSLKQAYVHVLTSNAASGLIRKKTGVKQ